MKNLFLTLIFVLGLSMVSISQNDVVSWKANVKKIEDNKYEISLTATIEDMWYIYSQYMEPGGPLPTEIELKDVNFKPTGVFNEYSNFEKKSFDDVFEMDVIKYAKSVDFSQKVSSKVRPSGTAVITFMSCNDDRCNPPKQVEVSF